MDGWMNEWILQGKEEGALQREQTKVIKVILDILLSRHYYNEISYFY